MFSRDTSFQMLLHIIVYLPSQRHHCIVPLFVYVNHKEDKFVVIGPWKIIKNILFSDILPIAEVNRMFP